MLGRCCVEGGEDGRRKDCYGQKGRSRPKIKHIRDELFLLSLSMMISFGERPGRFGKRSILIARWG